MSRYEHSADMGWKVNSEGSLVEFLFGYGLNMEDLPNDMPGHIRAYIRQCLTIIPALEEVEKYLNNAVENYEYAEWG